MKLPDLWPHQSDVLDRLRQSLVAHRASILCAQTGFGKSRCAKVVCGRSLLLPDRDVRTGLCLVAVHRRGLVDNLSDSFNEDPPLPHGVIMSQVDTAPRERLQIASIDSLISWYVDGESYTGPLFDLVVFDECHSHLSKLKTFLEVHDAAREREGLRPPYVLGLSATPRCEGLSDVFKDIVCGPSAEWLQANGFAARYRYMSGAKGRLGKLVRQGGEFTSESIDAAMVGLAGDFIRDWKLHAKERPTVGFFPRRSHAKEAMVQLVQAGVVAEYVDGETPDDERRAMYRALGEGDIQYICNVGVIERGTDIPEIGCVQLCTATGALVRYRQMIGRGSRVAEGKNDCLILDHGDNIKRHGFFEDEVAWTLDASSKLAKEHSEKPPVECPQCHELYRGGKCAKCGYEPTTREKKAQGLTFDGRDLVEVTRETRKVQAMHPEEIMTKALMIAGRSGRTLGQAAYIAKSIAREKGVDWVLPKCCRLAKGKRFPIDWSKKENRVAAEFPWTARRKRHV